MADIQPARDSWEITCNIKPSRKKPLIVSDIPNQVRFTSLGQVIDVLDPKLYPNNTSSHISTSETIRGYVLRKQIILGEYLHTHVDLADIDHAHEGLSTLVAGPLSDADLLHTHDNLAKLSDLEGLGGGDIDLSDFVVKSGGIDQLDDITSTGEEIESAVSVSHDEEHIILEHLDGEDPFTINNFKKLLDGSDADSFHIHAGVIIRKAFCTENAPTGSIIRCNLGTTGGTAINVVCQIAGQNLASEENLNSAVPRLESGDEIYVFYDGINWICVSLFQSSQEVINLDDLINVQISVPINGQYLRYDSSISKWTNQS